MKQEDLCSIPGLSKCFLFSGIKKVLGKKLPPELGGYLSLPKKSKSSRSELFCLALRPDRVYSSPPLSLPLPVEPFNVLVSLNKF